MLISVLFISEGPGLQYRARLQGRTVRSERKLYLQDALKNLLWSSSNVKDFFFLISPAAKEGISLKGCPLSTQQN